MVLFLERRDYRQINWIIIPISAEPRISSPVRQRTITAKVRPSLLYNPLKSQNINPNRHSIKHPTPSPSIPTASMDARHPSPFPYEDTLESSIQSLIARNNKFDPTGKLNDLRVPPRRVQQSLRRPKWYSPSLHASTPYLSASIAQTSSTLTPGVPLTLTITLHHHP